MFKRKDGQRDTSLLPEERSVSTSNRRGIWVTGVLLAVALVTAGAFAKNGWFPSTDPFAGKRTGWFGQPVAKNAGSSWNPLAAPLPAPTPQLSKEYIYAGSRLLSVVDSNAQEAPPADLAVWRPATGTWWVMGGQGSQQVTQAWGINGDKPLPGDYDGDGRTDFSVYRPLTHEWYVFRSSDSTWDPVIQWGDASDSFVPADYDGDGRTDRGVWRPGNGAWYIVKSSDGSGQQTFGLPGDIPIPADYDGDGSADLAVWRNSNKTFYSMNSSDDDVLTIGTGNQIPTDSYDWYAASSDYDGDGRAEYALYDKTAARWYIRQTTNGSITILPWGLGGDAPVHNDYDGDGKCDIAVWRPTDNPQGTLGKWFIRQSAFGNAERVEQWGIAGDVPVPAFYRR